MGRKKILRPHSRSHVGRHLLEIMSSPWVIIIMNEVLQRKITLLIQFTIFSKLNFTFARELVAEKYRDRIRELCMKTFLNIKSCPRVIIIIKEV